MIRIAPAALLAGLLAATGSGVADADPITYTTTPFSGTTTNYQALGVQDLPHTNADGSTVSSSDSSDLIVPGVGLAFSALGRNSDVLTYSMLPAGTTEVGFSFYTTYNISGDYLESAVFEGPGGFVATFNGGKSYDLSTTPYMGFTSTNAISTVILTFSTPGEQGDAMSSYVSGATPSAVPEPSSILMCGLGAIGAASLAARRCRRPAATA